MLIILEKIGWGMLALTGFVGGIIGLALPVIPQVPFFLLSLFALSKLSPRFHRWLTSRHWYQRMVVPVLEKFHAKRQTKKRVLIKAEQD